MSLYFSGNTFDCVISVDEVWCLWWTSSEKADKVFLFSCWHHTSNSVPVQTVYIWFAALRLCFAEWDHTRTLSSNPPDPRVNTSRLLSKLYIKKQAAGWALSGTTTPLVHLGWLESGIPQWRAGDSTQDSSPEIRWLWTAVFERTSFSLKLKIAMWTNILSGPRVEVHENKSSCQRSCINQQPQITRQMFFHISTPSLPSHVLFYYWFRKIKLYVDLLVHSMFFSGFVHLSK